MVGSRADVAWASAVSGCAATLAGHPLDSLKSHLQTSPGARQAIASWRRAGVWRGLAPPLANSVAMNVVMLGWFEESRGRLGGPLAGGLAGALGSFIGTPFDRFKILIQLGRRSRPPAGGWLGWLYTGHTMNLARESLFGVVYLGLYDWLRARHWPSEQGPVPLAATALLSGGTGALAWYAVYPIDVVKTIQQSEQHGRSVREVVRQLHAAEGIGGFYKGVGAGVLRAVLVTSTRLAVFEWILGRNRGFKDDQDS